MQALPIEPSYRLFLWQSGIKKAIRRLNAGAAAVREAKAEKINVAALSDQTPDIEAWSAVDDVEDEDDIFRVPILSAQGATEMQTEFYGSRTTRHMFPFCEQFITYQKIDARTITSANNKCCGHGAWAWVQSGTGLVC